MIIKAGSTNVSVYYYIVQDASGTSPGEPVTGLLFSDIETGGSASFMRQGGARVDLTLITLASASATHEDGGFILVDDTNMPGLYRCDYPDAAFVTGVDQTFCQIVVASANNAVAAPILIDIDDNVDQTGDNFARLGAPAGASVSADIADVPTVTEFNARTLLAGNYSTAGNLAIVDNIVDDIKIKTEFLPSATAGAAGGVFIAGTNAATVVTTSFTTTFTGDLTGSVDSVTGNVGGSVGSVTDPVTVGTMNANVINSTSIASGAMDGKGDWNIGKTGYTLTQTFPANFPDMSITASTGLMDITQPAANKTWLTPTRVLTAGTNLNDLSAGEVNAEVVDVLNVDTFAEPSGVPAATASIVSKLGFLMALARNKIITTSTLISLRNDSDTGNISTATQSDDTVTYNRNEHV